MTWISGSSSIERASAHVEFFGFSGNKTKGSLEKLYLNHPHLLKSFARHFTQTLSDILLPMQEAAFSLPEIKGKDFYCKKPIHPDLDDYAAFLTQLGYGGRWLWPMRFPREKECLKLLLIGHSAKEIAAALGLSPRTVEFYFENIRRKLSCWSKLDLFTLGLKFQELGLLP